MLDGETPGYIGRAEENRRRNLPDTGEKGRAGRRGWSWEPPTTQRRILRAPHSILLEHTILPVRNSGCRTKKDRKKKPPPRSPCSDTRQSRSTNSQLRSLISSSDCRRCLVSRDPWL